MPHVLCHPPRDAVAGDDAAAAGVDAEALPAIEEERDAETYDDAELYQQLLKQFLEASGTGSGAQALAKVCHMVRTDY